MQIHYCEKCGHRILVGEQDSATSVKVGDVYYCPGCVPAAAKPPSGPVQTLRKRPSTGAVKLPDLSAAPSTLKPQPRRETRTITPKAPVESGNPALLVGGVCAALLAIAIGVVILKNSRKETRPPGATGVKVPPTSVPDKKNDKPATVTTLPIPTPTPPSPPKTDAALAFDKEMEAKRTERANKILADARSFAANNPADPWGYRDQLMLLTQSYSSTPAAAEAKTMLAQIKFPEGPISLESVYWHRDYQFNNTPELHQEFDGRKFVMGTHPINDHTPHTLTRTIKVPSDAPFFHMEMRAHSDGDCRIRVDVNGVGMIDQDFGGKEWKVFALDFSTLKGSELKLVLTHRATGWNQEHAYWMAPRFVSAPAAGATVIPLDAKRAKSVNPDNLLSNPGFELGRWEPWSPWSPCDLTKDDKYVHKGEVSAYIKQPAGGFMQKVENLKPGGSYVLTAYVRVINDKDGIYVGVKDHGTPEVSQFIQQTTFTKVTVPFTMGAGNTTAYIYCYRDKGNGNVYADDLEVLPDTGAAPGK